MVLFHTIFNRLKMALRNSSRVINKFCQMLKLKEQRRKQFDVKVFYVFELGAMRL